MTIKIPNQGQRGSAVLIIVILLALMTVYVSSNAVALYVLKRNIQLVEKKQLSRMQNHPARGHLPKSNGQNIHD